MRVPLVALSMILLAGPVSAAELEASQKQAENAVPAKEKKYCIRYEDTTGTRVPIRECRTKADWARDGVEVGKPLKN